MEKFYRIINIIFIFIFTNSTITSSFLKENSPELPEKMTLSEYLQEEVEILQNFNIPTKIIHSLIDLSSKSSTTISSLLQKNPELFSLLISSESNINIDNNNNESPLLHSSLLSRKNSINPEYHPWYTTDKLDLSKIDIEKNTQWMKYISDSTLGNELSIPGTHDSGSFEFVQGWTPFKFVVNFLGRCQVWDIESQLLAGIRYLDIRVSPDDLHIYHGMLKTPLTFSEVMNICQKFLEKYHTEGIIMRLGIEDTSLPILGEDEEFEKIVEVLDFYRGEGLFYLSKELPNVGKLRGKIFLINEFEYYGAMIWRNEQMNLQDFYDLRNEKDMENKRDMILYFLDENKTRDKFVLNHLSCTGHPMGRSICYMADIFNQVVYYYPEKFWGIIAMDYPSIEMVDIIIKNNF